MASELQLQGSHQQLPPPPLPLPPSIEGQSPEALKAFFPYGFDPKTLTHLRQDLIRSLPHIYGFDSYRSHMSNETPDQKRSHMSNETPDQKQAEFPRAEEKGKEAAEDLGCDLKAQLSKYHCNHLIKAIRELRKEDYGLDVVIIAEGGYVRAHCCILACTSPFLKKVLVDNKDFPAIISVPGISYVTMKHLISCIYYGSLSVNANVQELIESAKHLGMESLVLVFSEALEQSKGKKRFVNDQLTELERPVKRRGNRLDQLLYQKLNANHLAPEQHDPPPPENAGILGELLMKNSDLSHYQNNSDNNRCNTPLNLSKSTSASSNKSLHDLSSSSYFRDAASVMSALNPTSFIGFPSFASGMFGQLSPSVLKPIINTSSYTPLTSVGASYPGLIPHQGLAGLAKPKQSLISKPKSAKHPKAPISSSINVCCSSNVTGNSVAGKCKQTSTSAVSQPILSQKGLFSSKNPALTQEILKELYDQMKLNPNLATLSPYSSISSTLPAMPSIQRLFPHLFASTTENLEGKLPPQDSCDPQSSACRTYSNNSIASDSVALNLTYPSHAIPAANAEPSRTSGSVAATSSKPPSPSCDVEKTTEPLDFTAPRSSEISESNNSADRDFSLKQEDAPPTTPVPPATGSSSESSQSNQTDSGTQTVSSVLATSAGLLDTSALLGSRHRNMPSSAVHFSSLGLRLALPSTLYVPTTSVIDLKGISPIDLSPIGLCTKNVLALQPILPTSTFSEDQTSDIDVVGSPVGLESRSLLSEDTKDVEATGFSSTASGSPMKTVSVDQTSNNQLKDSQPSTPDSVEVLEETVSQECVLSVQHRKPLFQTGNMGRKRKGCGECDGCQVAEDCGQCRFCRDKAKFGGPNRLKQVCVYKRCILIDSESEESRKRRKSLHKRKQTRCGRCDGCQRMSDCGDCYACLHNAAVLPPTRRKVCEMRVCEQQQIEEVRASLSVAEEPSPYSTDSLLAEGVIMGLSLSRSTSPTAEGGVSQKHKLKLTKKMVNKLNQQFSRVSPSKVRTKYYCGECPGCQTSTPCGNCLYCEDMPKFGGPGRYRQKCVKQLCVYHPRLQALKLSNRSKIHLEDSSSLSFNVESLQMDLPEECLAKNSVVNSRTIHDANKKEASLKTATSSVPLFAPVSIGGVGDNSVGSSPIVCQISENVKVSSKSEVEEALTSSPTSQIVAALSHSECPRGKVENEKSPSPPLDGKSDLTDDLEPPHSPPSLTRRGRGRGRRRGKGSALKSFRKLNRRGRRRKTPRFTVDPEDHSDYEDESYYRNKRYGMKSTALTLMREPYSSHVPSRPNSIPTDIYEFREVPSGDTQSSPTCHVLSVGLVSGGGDEDGTGLCDASSANLKLNFSELSNPVPVSETCVSFASPEPTIALCGLSLRDDCSGSDVSENLNQSSV